MKITYLIELNMKKLLMKKNNTVINQSIRAGKKIENTEIITITVARNTNNNDTNNDETNNEELENNTSTNESTNQNQEKNLQN